MRRRPPHIVVTTPESLYILLGSESGRAMLKTTRTVIVDEIHAVAPNKRGTHLAVSLERLAALCGDRLLRIGLSATQKPIETVARFLVGMGADGGEGPACTIIDSGHRRARDLALEVPDSPLEAVMSAEVWEQVYGRLAALIEAHRTTLIFVNTRRLAERVTRQLSDRLGEEHVTAHHGSLAKEQRFDAEQRLKHGKLKALVATASLELGIDIGDVDLVCQLGSPRSIAAFLQRVGRSGHAIDGTPKGRLFPLSRDELVECAALLDSVRRGELDRLAPMEQPLDVLAQQIVAEVAGQEWERGRALRPHPPRLAVSGAAARGFHHRGGHAGGGLQHPPRPPRRADPLRRRQSRAARPPRRAAHRPDRRRNHPGQRRLPGAAGAGEPFHRHRERGFRGREHGRRHLPARQQELPHHPRRARRGARGRRPRHGADHSVLAGRSAGPQRRAVGLGVAAARRRRRAPARATRPARRPCAGSSTTSASSSRRRGNWSSICTPGSRRWGACRRSTPSCSSGSSTRSAACSSWCIRPMAAASTAPGAWRCASASAASSISSCRRRRPRTISSSRSPPRTASTSTTCRDTCIRPASGRC